MLSVDIGDVSVESPVGVVSVDLVLSGEDIGDVSLESPVGAASVDVVS